MMRVKAEKYLKTLTENNREAALNAAKEAKDADGNPLPVADASSVAENGNYQISLERLGSVESPGDGRRRYKEGRPS